MEGQQSLHEGGKVVSELLCTTMNLFVAGKSEGLDGGKRKSGGLGGEGREEGGKGGGGGGGEEKK